MLFKTLFPERFQETAYYLQILSRHDVSNAAKKK